ncbi:putative Kv channel-interacting protein 1 isoform X3 [Penaeus vannamei]|uniref:Putative Kv channel-interacting protein 1 isoform X3 n=1 Tax=Penaeus vannamei TaxID=6689 RepID=A0A423SKM4_PENVA|nr:putative Kv channel-interacting protein 1 isoform X3 [Penaeus vannamei]
MSHPVFFLSPFPHSRFPVFCNVSPPFSFSRPSHTLDFPFFYSELEIIEQEPRYRPEDINALCRTTHFTRPELQRLYRSFKDRCPTGVVREDAFKELYFQMFPKGG